MSALIGNDPYRRSIQTGFTLVELLVVIGLIALLSAMLLPAVSVARQSSQRVRCLSNLHAIGAAIFSYAASNSGDIPYGPKAPPTNPLDFYPGTGDVTSLISLQSGKPVGLGLLLKNELDATPRALFCPGVDQPDTADMQLSRVGRGQAQSDYYYIHGTNVSFSDAVSPEITSHLKLAALGLNGDGKPMRALVMDVNYNVPSDPLLATFGVVPRTNHQQKFVSTLYADGRAEALDNDDRSLSIDASSIYFSLLNIRAAFAKADVR